MKNNWLLLVGITFLVIGILLRTTTDLTPLPSVLLSIGVFMKILYLLVKIKDGTYKPGFELSALVIGLLLFFWGRYLNTLEIDLYPILLMVSGIVLKVSFIFLVIRKIRGQVEVS
jgi:hypothetical protein